MPRTITHSKASVSEYSLLTFFLHSIIDTFTVVLSCSIPLPDKNSKMSLKNNNDKNVSERVDSYISSHFIVLISIDTFVRTFVHEHTLC